MMACCRPPFSPLALPLCLLLLAHSLVLAQRTEWESANFPNPTSGDFQRCNMRSRSLLCDPDSVLSEAERYRVNYELQQLEASTRQENARDFCERKGITAAVALAKKVRGGNNELRTMANRMLERWTLDSQCNKAIMAVLSVDDQSFWVARMPRVPVYGTELNELFANEKETFRSGKYAQGVQNVLRSIRDKAVAKQQPGPAEDGRSRGTPFVPPGPPKQKEKKEGGGLLKKLNWLWLLLLIFFVILPLLCCCCCIYFCCFRKKDGGAHPDQEAGGPPAAAGHGAGGRGRMGGLPLAGLIGGISGAATNLFNKRRGGGAAGPGQAPPPYYDPVPQKDGQQPAGVGGKGLYPSEERKDQGGGGSW